VKGIGYIRVSRVGQRKGDSFLAPQLQLESIERVCQREGVELVDVYEELDKSGGDAARPLWNRAIERIESGEVQALVCWNLSRFARSILDAKRALDRIEKTGGRLLSEEGAEGLSRDILFVVAEHERLRRCIPAGGGVSHRARDPHRLAGTDRLHARPCDQEARAERDGARGR
jgi:DNA invertase Pin-like site-specific DNA recombinase